MNKNIALSYVLLIGWVACAEDADTAASSSSAGSSGKPEVAAPSASGDEFSFFVTSLQGMLELSGNQNGFGGDLRYGEPTGLAGADKICRALAEKSLPGSGKKDWRAFLSTAKGGEGDGPIHARDRIGTGPWYDRAGRLIAMDLSSLMNPRPLGADPAIIDDLPNERGEPNRTDMTGTMADNHDVVTGTNQQGMWDGTMTCGDWTSTQTPTAAMGAAGAPAGTGPPAAGSGGSGSSRRGGGRFAMDGPRLGHSWPSQLSGVSWSTAHKAPGCEPSVSLVQMGVGTGTGIGNSGGYGGIYCFALTP